MGGESAVTVVVEQNPKGTSRRESGRRAEGQQRPRWRAHPVRDRSAANDHRPGLAFEPSRVELPRRLGLDRAPVGSLRVVLEPCDRARDVEVKRERCWCDEIVAERYELARPGEAESFETLPLKRRESCSLPHESGQMDACRGQAGRIVLTATEVALEQLERDSRNWSARISGSVRPSSLTLWVLRSSTRRSRYSKAHAARIAWCWSRRRPGCGRRVAGTPLGSDRAPPGPRADRRSAPRALRPRPARC